MSFLGNLEERENERNLELLSIYEYPGQWLSLVNGEHDCFLVNCNFEKRRFIRDSIQL